MLLLSVPLFAQQTLSVSGHVRDEAGDGLIGVVVILDGSTTVATSTGMDGSYSIRVPAGSSLRFSLVGYTGVTVPVEGRTVVDVTLAEEVQTIDNVVVVGYGTQRKKDLTSAITVVDSDAMQRAPVGDINSALQGLAAGVDVQGNDGSPGSLPTVRIRGVSTANGDGSPLYVVDGIPSEAWMVNTADVESMQVLKDAASAAIYGSRGANGVIIITTKRGQSGAPRVRYSGYYGFAEPWKMLDVLNPQQWGQLITDVNTNAGGVVPDAAKDLAAGYNGPVTDWQKEMFQRGAIYEQNLDISGGTDSGNYYFSLNQFGQDGIMIETPYKRYSVRMNSNWRAGRFRFGENMSFNYTERRRESNDAGRSNLEQMLKLPGSIPVHSDNPAHYGGFTGYDRTYYGIGATNPVAVAKRIRNMDYGRNFAANVYGEYEFIDGLTFRSTFGFSSYESENTNFQMKSNYPPANERPNSSLSESSRWSYNWVWENTATFQRTFGQHELTVMAGYTSEYNKSRNFNAAGNTFQTESNPVLGLAEVYTASGGGQSELARVSMLGRVNYIYKGRYMLTANIRRDGSSKFHPDYRYGVFPSASVAWRMSDEAFMSEIDWISNLKLRASYGVVGNDMVIGNYPWQPTISRGQGWFFSQNYNYIFDGQRTLGASIADFVNYSLGWETVKQTDIGIDLGLFRDRLEITADWYDKRTENMLIGRPLAPSLGVGGTQGGFGTLTSNLGEILNRGFEFSATWRKPTGDFRYSVTANFATLHNEVLDMSGNPIMAGAVEFGASVSRTDVGHPIGSFYVYEADGIFRSEAEVNAHSKNGQKIQPDAAPGDVRFLDKDGSGAIDAGDLDYMGSPIPKFSYGLNINLDWKGLDLSMFFQGVAGNTIYAELLAWTEGMHNNFNQTTAVLDRWSTSNPNGKVPRAMRGDPNGNIQKSSSRYLFKGDYLRLKNITLGYTLPKNWVNAIKLEDIRVYLTGRNLLTFTKYPYYDPEIGSGAQGVGGNFNTARGIDNGIYPQARTLIFGVQIGF